MTTRLLLPVVLDSSKLWMRRAAKVLAWIGWGGRCPGTCAEADDVEVELGAYVSELRRRCCCGGGRGGVGDKNEESPAVAAAL
jgi:hypothetical protein